jgi:hypothetical protein
MRTPDYALGPDDSPPPEITEASIYAAILGDEPVLLLLPRFALAQIAADGGLVTGDGLDSAMRARGAVSMIDWEFAGTPVPGWHAVRDESAATLRITGPDGTACYDGSLDTNTQWQELVVQRGRGVVVIACSAATPEAALDELAAGRACWVRVPITLR